MLDGVKGPIYPIVWDFIDMIYHVWVI